MVLILPFLKGALPSSAGGISKSPAFQAPPLRKGESEVWILTNKTLDRSRIILIGLYYKSQPNTSRSRTRLRGVSLGWCPPQGGIGCSPLNGGFSFLYLSHGITRLFKDLSHRLVSLECVANKASNRISETDKFIGLIFNPAYFSNCHIKAS